MKSREKKRTTKISTQHQWALRHQATSFVCNWSFRPQGGGVGENYLKTLTAEDIHLKYTVNTPWPPNLRTKLTK